jgi:hypothetical protein
MHRYFAFGAAIELEAIRQRVRLRRPQSRATPCNRTWLQA